MSYENLSLAELRQLAVHAVFEVANSHTDNEITAYPVWWIVDRGMGRDVQSTVNASTGPFWSREAAEDWKAAHPRRFGKKATVYCSSANEHPLRELIDLSRALAKAGGVPE